MAALDFTVKDEADDGDYDVHVCFWTSAVFDPDVTAQSVGRDGFGEVETTGSEKQRRKDGEPLTEIGRGHDIRTPVIIVAKVKSGDRSSCHRQRNRLHLLRLD